MGAYILAKDEVANYSGPDWVPFSVWQFREYPNGSSDRANKLRMCADRLISGAGAREIWEAIGARYKNSNAIAAELPVTCAEILEHWENLPKLTPSAHKRAREELRRKADQLAVALERYYLSIDPIELADIEVTAVPNFTQLLSEDELADMDARIHWHHYTVATTTLAAFGSGLKVSFQDFQERVECMAFPGMLELLIMDDRQAPGIVPSLPEMMRRIGTFLEDDKDRPPLAKPNTQNADRNYFVRRLIAYFAAATGDMSPALIARITSLFFTQGITDNEVQQQRGRLPSGHLLRRHEG